MILSTNLCLNSAGSGAYLMSQKRRFGCGSQMHSSCAATPICTTVARWLRDVQKWYGRSIVMVCSAVRSVSHPPHPIQFSTIAQSPRLICSHISNAALMRLWLVVGIHCSFFRGALWVFISRMSINLYFLIAT